MGRVNGIAATEEGTLHSQNVIHPFNEQAAKMGHSDAQLTVRRSKKGNST